MAIAAYIREIGRGKDGARSLDEAQAHDLMSQVLDGNVSDLELGAFALAMRIKGESVAELAGFQRAVEARCIGIDAPGIAVVLPSYNGARRIANLTALLALALARASVPVLVHGLASDPARVTTAEIFRALGLPWAGSAADVATAWQRGEPAFIDTESLCPPLARLLAVRRVVGLRNSGHTIAKLLAGCRGATLRVVNYTHPDYGTLLADYFAISHADALLMRGTEGEPVADARRLQKLNVYLAGSLHPELSRSAHEGSIAAPPALPAGSDAAATAAWIASVLDGAVSLPAPIAAQIECLVATRAAMAAR